MTCKIKNIKKGVLMNYRYDKQQTIDNNLRRIAKSMKKEESKEMSTMDSSSNNEFKESSFEEVFTLEPVNKYIEFEFKRKDIKNNQYQMAKNKSKTFHMLNVEGNIKDIYLNMYIECPLALAIFDVLLNNKCIENFCEISQREIAKEVNAPLSEVEKAMKYLYNKKIVCILSKKDLKDLEFDRKELNQVYFISMRFVWSGSQIHKKYIMDIIPKDFRYEGNFKKFCTLDKHISMNKVLNNLVKENRYAFGTFFIMALFMNTKNRYFVTIKGLAKKIKKSLNYVTKLINVLIEKGFVRQDESCFVINSTIIWNRNQTKTFQNDIAEIFPQRKKRFSRHVKDNHEIMLMYLNAKRDMYLNNTLWKTFI